MQKYCNRITNYGEWENLHCTNFKPNNHNTKCLHESELLSVFSELFCKDSYTKSHAQIS